ncbi:MAG: T9SS type A sorting domain-containing protein, partial [Bacteroidetes bacterium]|nr:T9SS type A sorting domain-containing protein [Bacteroidota bacterium]
IGISNEGAGDSLTISNNSVDSLLNTASSAAVHIVGLYNANNTSGTNSIDRNRIFDLYLSSTNLASSLTGIHLTAGTATYKNNMVNLGNGVASEYIINGLLDAATTANNFFFNTVVVGGTGVGTTANNTYAFRRSSAGTDNMQNNIFINDRSNSSTGGKHYAVYLTTSTSLTTNYNLYHGIGTGFVFGFRSSLDRTTLGTWQSGFGGQDVNAVSVAVTFISSSDLHLSGGSIGDVNLIAAPMESVTTDVDGEMRDPSFPYKGADEASTALPVELVSFTASAQRLIAELKWSTATEVNNLGFEVERKSVSGFKVQGSGNSTSNMNPACPLGRETPHSSWTRIAFVEGAGTANGVHEYTYSDHSLSGGTYAFRLKQIDRNGKFSYSPEAEVTVGSVPNVFALEQNYPNPFNPSTTIGFTLQVSGLAILRIYDAVGRETAVIVNENLEAGVYHQRVFNAGKLSSGIYFARLISSGQTMLKRMVLLK